MLTTLLAQASDAAQALDFDRPPIDWHAFAPELVLLGVTILLVIIDVVWTERARTVTGAIAGVGLLAVMIPIITLAIDGVASDPRVMFDGAYVVDGFALVMKAMFVLSGYVVVLMSLNYMSEGDYWENEYYELMLASLLGMLLMASARDLVSIFVALELLSIPAYLMATWRKRDPRSNEAGMKYYLMGVFASAILLYGMSLLFGASGSTILADIGAASSGEESTMLAALAIVFVVAGLAFKVSAFPFHSWAPDTYEGAPTPVTAYLSVASKAAGFVALMQLVFIGFWGRDDIYGPLIWMLAAASMFAGNFIALRQTNIVRMMAYSGVAQAGFMLAPMAVAGESAEVAQTSLTATVTYLVIYAAMNLGAFAVIIAVARKTRSAELDSWNGLFSYAPALAVSMTLFLAALGGIPPLAGWFAKFSVFAALVNADTIGGYSLAVIAAINTVIAFGYYGKVASKMWFEEAPDSAPVTVPFALRSAVALALIATLVFGVLPNSVTHFTDVSLVALGS